MFALPTLDASIAVKIGTALLSAPIARLGHTMIDAGMIEAADLRTGSAGAQRMIERTWARWQAEDGLPASLPQLPVSFCIVDPHEPWLGPQLRKSASATAWLVLVADRAPARWYVGRVCDELIKAGHADLAEHALATLYAGLDDICYAPKPPEFLAWARAFWWKGFDNEKAANIKRPPDNARDIPTRRRFDNRYPLICQAPQQAPIRRQSRMGRAFAGYADLKTTIAAVELARRSRHLLRPNLHEFTNAPAINFAVFVRYWGGDYLQRLVDTYFYHARKQKHLLPVHGAWPLATAEDIMRARRGIAANTRLAQALVALCNQLGYIASQSMGGHW